MLFFLFYTEKFLLYLEKVTLNNNDEDDNNDDSVIRILIMVSKSELYYRKPI